jgi:hypothetical protein
VNPYRVASSALLSCALAWSSACTSTHNQLGFDNDALVTQRLAAVNPADVVVLPIENQTGREDLPLDEIRAEFQSGLIKRLYSPLALDYVDRAAVEASYRPGTLGEQGVLQVVITGWDDSMWRSHSRLIVDADVYMLDAAAPERSSALWGGHAKRRIELTNQRVPGANPNSLMPDALRELAAGILVSLPARDPQLVR